MAERSWSAGLPAHEVEALSRTACDYADQLLPCACGGGAETPPCYHALGCPARFRGAVATALCEARTYDRRHGERLTRPETNRPSRAPQLELVDMLRGRGEELELEAQICRIRSRRQEGDQQEHLEVAAEALDAAARDLRAGVAALGGGTFLRTVDL